MSLSKFAMVHTNIQMYMILVEQIPADTINKAILQLNKLTFVHQNMLIFLLETDGCKK